MQKSSKLWISLDHECIKSTCCTFQTNSFRQSSRVDKKPGEIVVSFDTHTAPVARKVWTINPSNQFLCL